MMTRDLKVKAEGFALRWHDCEGVGCQASGRMIKNHLQSIKLHSPGLKTREIHPDSKRV